MKNKTLNDILQQSVDLASKNQEGKPASYIPELANADTDKTGAAVTLCDGTTASAGNCDDHHFTLQSTSKLVLLIGLLEEYGQDQVFKWIGVEPTGHSFCAIDYTDRYTHRPSNPMINAGAIALSNHIPGGNRQQQMNWVELWVNKLFNAPLRINHKIYASELDSADNNRSIAYQLRSQNIITGDIEQTIKVYTALCSFEANILQSSYLPMLLAHQGKDSTGTVIIHEKTVKAVVSIMATCGLYNETGTYLLRTGMPAKSGVSGLILATGIGYGGLAVFSPRLTTKGGSVRGQIMLEHIAKELGWHFALQGKA